MADEEGGSNPRKVALVAGLGLIGLGTYQLLKKPTAGATGPAGQPGPTGPAGPPGGITNFIVTATDGLIVRTGPSRSASVVGTLPYGTPIYVICQLAGENVNGSSAVWDRVLRPLNGYCYDWWVNTPGVGRFTPGISVCAGSGALPAGSGGGVKPSGGPSNLPPTGTAQPPAVISNPNAVQPGWIIATGCGWNQANYVVIHDSSRTNGNAGPLARVWIKDYRTWQRLGAPRNAIRVVTGNVIYSIFDRGAIYFDGTWHWDTKPSFWPPQLTYPKPPNIVASNAGYCS